MLIDTHAHLYWDSFKDDLDEVIKHSIQTGVTTMINVGVDVEKSREALRQAQRIFSEQSRTIAVYSTIGIHPHESVKYLSGGLEEDIKKLEEIYSENPTKVIGVGECGLDYFFDPEFTPKDLTVDQLKDLQRQLFKAQIDLAKKLNLPLIIHCRDDRSKDPKNSEAWDETLEIIEDYPAILHCYSGLSSITNKIFNMENTLVSFAATLTYPKNDYLREAARLLPLEKIVLETDCPFLPPQSKRGQRNEPSTVKEIAQLIADLKGVSFEEVANQTTDNANRILNIDPSTRFARSR